MKITIDKTKVTIGQSVDHIKNVSYAYTLARDSVTFFINDNYKTISVDETIVNGTQMTPHNIDQLLADLFKETSCNSGSSQQSDWLENNPTAGSYILNRPHSQQPYAEPLVFPTAVCTGHTLDILKDDKLYQTYQWNGWLWEQIGIEPSFIFKEASGQRQNGLSDFPMCKKSNDTYYIRLDEGFRYDANLYASAILKSDMPFEVYGLHLYLDDQSVDKFHLIENIGTLPGRIEIEYIDEIANIHRTKAIYLKNISRSHGFLVDTPLSDVSIEDAQLYAYPEYGVPAQVKAHSIMMLNTDSNGATIQLYPSPIPDEVSTIDLRENIFDFQVSDTIGAQLLFESVKRTDGTYDVVKRAQIVYKDNESAHLNIEGVDAAPTIESIDLDASKVFSASFINIEFTDTAFASLIEALTSVQINQVALTYTNCTPTLTDAHRKELAAAGWKLQ